jgi:hypothetical protein
MEANESNVFILNSNLSACFFEMGNYTFLR